VAGVIVVVVDDCFGLALVKVQSRILVLVHPWCSSEITYCTFKVTKTCMWSVQNWKLWKNPACIPTFIL